jgi:hypothetical protein
MKMVVTGKTSAKAGLAIMKQWFNDRCDVVQDESFKRFDNDGSKTDRAE